MSAVKILIVEDEIIIAETISLRLKKAGYIITAIASNGEDAVASVKEDKPDLVIMDIHLHGKKDGIVTTAALKKLYDIPVIFLTDMDDEHTIQRASSVKPAAYLLKPFNERQIIASICQALHNATHSLQAKPGEQELPLHDYYILNDCLFIRVEKNHFKKILLNDILFLEAEGSYSYIHTVDGKKHMYSKSMNHVHEQISNTSFIQVNRSYVVNLEKVDGVKGNQLLVNGKELLMGDKYKEEVMKRLPVLK